MKSYDLPETDDLTPDEAKRAVHRLRADILADPRHPFNDSNHAQHGDFSDCFRELNSIIAQDENDVQAERAARERADALGEDVALTPAECLDRAEELMKTPGYLAGTLPVKDREYLTRKIHALHEAAANQQEPDPSTPEEEEISDEL